MTHKLQAVYWPAESSKLFEETFEELSGRKPARIGYITEGNAGHLTFSDS